MNSYNLMSNVEIIEDIANKIKRKRLAMNLSQEELSKKTGISVHAISNIENGKSFSLDNLIKIMRALNCINNLENIIPVVLYDPYLALDKKEEKKKEKILQL